MMFRLASLVAILSTAMTTVDTAAGVYNYDETHVWDQVEPLATNECGGSKKMIWHEPTIIITSWW